ncbi:MAG: helix-turn-helix transcriptional regulator [Chloroflexota bacterium]|nr:helix-turn-helix transcriptional regulator [Chloroflexota bacterium]
MNIRELRERHNLSQHALAHKAGLSQAAVSKIEAGNVGPNRATRRALAEALGVDEDQVKFPPRRRKEDR